MSSDASLTDRMPTVAESVDQAILVADIGKCYQIYERPETA